MAPGHETRVLRRVRAARAAGVLPLVAAIMSAAALTGAAVYTVDRASCADPAQYIRHDNHVELVGGCVNTADLPAVTAPDEVRSFPAPGEVQHGNYRP
jgi:hypothetical protein